MQILFYIAAVIAVASTVMVITLKTPVQSLLYLIVSLLAIAVMFYIMGAPFVAALEVIVYAGAIMVLFIFVIMMLNLGKETVEYENQLFYPGIWIGPAFLVLLLIIEIGYLILSNNNGKIDLHTSDARAVGTSLFTTYLLGVELAGFLLLAGIIGAYHLGYKKKKSLHRFLDTEEVE